MNMFARFDEIPAMTLQTIKETKRIYTGTTFGGYTKVVCIVHLSDQIKYNMYLTAVLDG